MVEEKKEETKKTLGERIALRFNTWLVTKGWIYFLVFIMGFLFGGLVFK